MRSPDDVFHKGLTGTLDPGSLERQSRWSLGDIPVNALRGRATVIISGSQGSPDLPSGYVSMDRILVFSFFVTTSVTIRPVLLFLSADDRGTGTFMGRGLSTAGSSLTRRETEAPLAVFNSCRAQLQKVQPHSPTAAIQRTARRQIARVIRWTTPDRPLLPCPLQSPLRLYNSSLQSYFILRLQVLNPKSKKARLHQWNSTARRTRRSRTFAPRQFHKVDCRGLLTVKRLNQTELFM